MRSLFLIVLVGLLCLQPHALSAAEETQLPAELQIGGSTLQLNGTGLRTATIFKVRVYEGALYLEERSKDAEAILASPKSKALVMHFLRDVSAEKLRDGFKEGLKKNSNDADHLSNELAEFNALLSDAEEGQRIQINLTNAGVGVSVDGQDIGAVAGADFSRALLSVWLGPEPPNESLKEGMLGL